MFAYMYVFYLKPMRAKDRQTFVHLQMHANILDSIWQTAATVGSNNRIFQNNLLLFMCS